MSRRNKEYKLIAHVIFPSHGQDILLLERRQLLQTLYDYLPDKSRLRVGCEVKTIKQDKDGVEVILADGTVEKGDMVLGADGVRSPVRSMMWEHANKKTPGFITAEEKRKSMQMANQHFLLFRADNAWRTRYEN